jgi:hypothetical protein
MRASRRQANPSPHTQSVRPARIHACRRRRRCRPEISNQLIDLISLIHTTTITLPAGRAPLACGRVFVHRRQRRRRKPPLPPATILKRVVRLAEGSAWSRKLSARPCETHHLIISLLHNKMMRRSIERKLLFVAGRTKDRSADRLAECARYGRSGCRACRRNRAGRMETIRQANHHELGPSAAASLKMFPGRPDAALPRRRPKS